MTHSFCKVLYSYIVKYVYLHKLYILRYCNLIIHFVCMVTYFDGMLYYIGKV